MLTALFGVFAVVVAILGFRGQTERRPPVALLPRHEVPAEVHEPGPEPLLRRRPREPPAAREHDPVRRHRLLRRRRPPRRPNPDFLKADRRYYFGVANADAKRRTRTASRCFNKPVWKDGKLAGEGYFVNHIPPLAVEKAGGWEAADQARPAAVQRPLRGLPRRERPRRRRRRRLRHRRRLRAVRSRPSNSLAPDMQAQPDGQLFNTITNGVRTMPAYGHQVKVQDRWAIVAYLRVLQYAAGNRQEVGQASGLSVKRTTCPRETLTHRCNGTNGGTPPLTYPDGLPDDVCAARRPRGRAVPQPAARGRAWPGWRSSSARSIEPEAVLPLVSVRLRLRPRRRARRPVLGADPPRRGRRLVGRACGASTRT